MRSGNLIIVLSFVFGAGFVICYLLVKERIDKANYYNQQLELLEQKNLELESGIKKLNEHIRSQEEEIQKNLQDKKNKQDSIIQLKKALNGNEFILSSLKSELNLIKDSLFYCQSNKDRFAFELSINTPKRSLELLDHFKPIIIIGLAIFFLITFSSKIVIAKLEDHPSLLSNLIGYINY